MRKMIVMIFACAAIATWLMSGTPSSSSDKSLLATSTKGKRFLEIGETYTFMFSSGKRLDDAKVVEESGGQWVKVEGVTSAPVLTSWVNLHFVEAIHRCSPTPDANRKQTEERN